MSRVHTNDKSDQVITLFYVISRRNNGIHDDTDCHVLLDHHELAAVVVAVYSSSTNMSIT